MQTHAQGFDYPSIAEVECPFPTLSRIREAGSVHQVGENRYLVSHYEDVEFVLRREDLFTGCSEERLNPFDWPGPEPVPEHSLTSTGMVKNVIELDPPHHKARRDRMFQLLKPARVRGYRPWIEEIVDGLIDGFIDDGRVELMTQFAYPMPTQLIIRILGLSPEDFPWMHAWGIAEWKGGEQYLTDDMVEGQKPHILDAGPRITAEILKRVEQPTDDGLSETIQAQIAADGAFNLGIVRADLGQFVGAGITTTGHLVSSAMLTLVESPALMAEMRGHVQAADLPRGVPARGLAAAVDPARGPGGHRDRRRPHPEGRLPHHDDRVGQPRCGQVGRGRRGVLPAPGERDRPPGLRQGPALLHRRPARAPGGAHRVRAPLRTTGRHPTRCGHPALAPREPDVPWAGGPAARVRPRIGGDRWTGS